MQVIQRVDDLRERECLRCPSCHKFPEIGKYDFTSLKGPSYEIGCTNLDCNNPLTLDGFMDAKDALDRWNTEVKLKQGAV